MRTKTVQIRMKTSEILPANYMEIVEEVTNGIYEAYPFLLEKYGEHGKERCKEDNIHHLKTLETAFQVKDEKIFVDYTIWLNSILTSRGMKSDLIIDNFKRLLVALDGKLEEEAQASFYISALNSGVAELEGL